MVVNVAQEIVRVWEAGLKFSMIAIPRNPKLRDPEMMSALFADHSFEENKTVLLPSLAAPYHFLPGLSFQLNTNTVNLLIL